MAKRKSGNKANNKGKKIKEEDENSIIAQTEEDMDVEAEINSNSSVNSQLPQSHQDNNEETKDTREDERQINSQQQHNDDDDADDENNIVNKETCEVRVMISSTEIRNTISKEDIKVRNTEKDDERPAEKNNKVEEFQPAEKNNELEEFELAEKNKKVEEFETALLDATDSQLCNITEQSLKTESIVPDDYNETNFGVQCGDEKVKQIITNLSSMNRIIMDAKRDLASIRLKISNSIKSKN